MTLSHYLRNKIEGHFRCTPRLFLVTCKQWEMTHLLIFRLLKMEEKVSKNYKKLKTRHLRSLLGSEVQNSENLNREILIDHITNTSHTVHSQIHSEGDTDLPPFASVLYTPLEDDNVPLIPSLNFSCIFNYMVTKENPSMNYEPSENYRGLDRAVQHFEAGDVQNLLLSKVDDKVVYLKGQCRASMRKIMYTVYIASNFMDDILLHSLCECPIGQGMSCSHIGAMLLALEESKRLLPKASTSQLCKWKVPRPMKVQPLPLKSITMNKSKISADLTSIPVQKQTVETFDPRHSEDRTTSQEHLLSELRKLQDVFPKSGVLQMRVLPCENVPEAVYTTEVTTELTEQEKLDHKIKTLIFDGRTEPPMMISEAFCKQIEQQTIGQRDNTVWRELHKGRLTSSMFGDILSSKTSAPLSLLKKIIHGSDLDKYSRLPEAIQWGIDNEVKAREEYLEFKALFGTVEYEDTGLRLLPECSYIGASSDGKVTDHSMPPEFRNGVIEIKCPFSVDKIQVNNLEISDIADMPNSFLENSDSGPSLKKSHKYYAQVQGEMYVYGVTWCDFVVWTNAPANNINIERIDFDEGFVENMLTKLKHFYCSKVKPALIQSVC